jgi:hypothetical protein
MRQLLAVVVVMGSACASRHNVMLTFGVQPGPRDAVLGSLVRQARTLGYVEEMADPSMCFFSVQARTTLGGLQYTGATSRNKKRNRAASGVKFNVQCSETGETRVVPVGVEGPIEEGEKIDKHLLKELREFMDGLSAAQPMNQFAPPPPPPQ